MDNIKSFFDDLKNNPDHKGIKYDIINIIYRIFTIVSIFLFMITIVKLFASYTYFTNILLSILYKVKELFDKEANNNLIIIIQIMIICVIFFWALIYNEIIEINCCGCSDYTQKNQISRIEQDEKRKSDWLTNKVNMDADATIMDDNFNNNDITNSGDNMETGTLVTMKNYLK